MNYTTVLTPSWANTEHTLINVTVNFENIGEVQFIASPLDAEPHGKEIYDRCVAGEFGVIAPFVPAVISNVALAASARSKRDALLASTDWSQLADVPQPTKDKWAPYRQALRDVPTQTGFPANIIWPAAPV